MIIDNKPPFNSHGINSLLAIVPQKQWENDAENMFNVQSEFNISPSLKLGDIASITFGLQTADKKTYVKESSCGDDWELCYTGKDVNKFYLPNPSLYFLNKPQEVFASLTKNDKI